MHKVWGIWEIPHFQLDTYAQCNVDDDIEMGVTRFILAYKELAAQKGASSQSLSRLTFRKNSKGKTIRDTTYYQDLYDLISFLFKLGRDPQEYFYYQFQQWDRNHKARICRGLAREEGNRRVLHGAGVAFPSMKVMLDPDLREGHTLFNAGHVEPRRHFTLDKRFEQYNAGWDKKIKNWARSTGRPEEEFWAIPHHFYYCFLENPNYIYIIRHLNQEKSKEVFLNFFGLTSLDVVCRGFHEMKAAEEAAYQQRANGEVDASMLVDAGTLLRSSRKQQEVEHIDTHAGRGWDIRGVPYIVKMLREVYPEVAPPTRWEFVQKCYNWSEDTWKEKWEERFGKKETWDILTDSVVNPYDVLSGKVDPEEKLKLYA